MAKERTHYYLRINLSSPSNVAEAKKFQKVLEANGDLLRDWFLRESKKYLEANVDLLSAETLSSAGVIAYAKKHFGLKISQRMLDYYRRTKMRQGRRGDYLAVSRKTRVFYKYRRSQMDKFLSKLSLERAQSEQETAELEKEAVFGDRNFTTDTNLLRRDETRRVNVVQKVKVMEFYREED